MMHDAEPGFPPESRNGSIRFCGEASSGGCSEGSLKPVLPQWKNEKQKRFPECPCFFSVSADPGVRG